jgi:hypothetical protein
VSIRPATRGTGNSIAAGAGGAAGPLAGRSRRRPTRRMVAGAAAVTAAAVLVAGVLAWQAGKTTSSAPAAAPVQTTTVTRTDLSTTQTLTGTLGYGSTVPVTGTQSGIVTWLPASGAGVSRGQPLYRVDNRPVPVFYGHTPLYRSLVTAGMVGPDVKMVADNLTALGYDIGYQPPAGTVITEQPPPATPGTGHPASQSSPASTPGSAGAGAPAKATAGPAPSVSTPPAAQPVTATVGSGDAVLTTSLIAAIKLWQTAEGMTPTGVLSIGDVMVEPGAVQVASVQAQIGGPATGTLMSVTTTTPTVTVSADSTAIPSLRRSSAVTVTLPDNSTTTGTITSISATVQSAQATSDNQAQQTVTISLGNPAAAAGLAAASVQVAFTGQTRNGVLAVPVGALLALSGGGYAVQRPNGRLIPVQTGMFAQGMVEISGPGIVPGLRVVTTS